MGAKDSFGVLVFNVTRSMEENTAAHTYESIAASALADAQHIALQKQQGAEALATALSFSFPDASTWPMVGMYGYTQLAQKVSKLSGSVGHGFMAIVKPEEVEEFEAHAKKMYQDFGYPENAGYSDFGFGIYGMDKKSGYEDRRFHDHSGNTTWGSTYSIMTPFLQHKNTFDKPTLLMRNLHQFELRGKLIDEMISCGEAVDPSSSPEFPSCKAITDFTEIFVLPGPSAVYFTPIYPANDHTTTVGFIGASVNWQETLTNIFPSFVDGIDCVISNGKQSYTYTIHEGAPTLVGEGDLHDPKFTSYGRNITLIKNEKMEASVSFELILYPTQAMFNDFRTNIPKAMSIAFVSVTLICTAIFLLYDYFMKYESHQRKKILQLKRRFVSVHACARARVCADFWALSARIETKPNQLLTLYCCRSVLYRTR